MRMHMQQRVIPAAFAIAFLISASARPLAQTPYRWGQGLQPIYEGWEKSSDGTVSMVFGYLNRNFEEAPHVPIGSNNFFDGGAQDRGQPTHFDTRRQSFIFRVSLPADWGKKELTWTLIHNGYTGKAVGRLTPNWAIDEGVWRANRGAGINGRTAADYIGNSAPVIELAGPKTIKARVQETVALKASARDDGRPGPRPPRKSGGEGGAVARVVLSNPDLPTVGGNHSGAASGTGGPTDQNVVQVSVAYQTGLAVTWRHYRGPGTATFDPRAVPVKADGQAATAVRFSEPGTHVIRAVADDSTYTTGVDITVVVEGPAQDVRR
jgi:hypothetical protein